MHDAEKHNAIQQLTHISSPFTLSRHSLTHRN